ncbi:MAG: hypothetical protein GX456_10270 [Verrucomicrobia bacterium]|nr:hypothetical protein [Verrucomicrobiota bacterium]
MKTVLRVVAYVVLLAGALVFGHRFIDAYAKRADAAARRYDAIDQQSSARDALSTPTAPGETNDTSPAVATNGPGAGSITNVAVTITNNASLETAATNATAPAETSGPSPAITAPPPLGLSAAITLAAVVGLALLLAQDLSRFVAERIHQSLHDDEGKVMGNPEYEQAEQVWANGDYLEAIRLFREFLAKNPRQVHVALRIAEIYEKDLSNNLAAALEYEEILKHKLDPERWGWAAIHLCNLYNRIGQPAKAEALLRRIVDEYGETAAAAKARERLTAIESESQPQPAAQPSQPSSIAVSSPATDTGPKLPPGFRPKKRRG